MTARRTVADTTPIHLKFEYAASVEKNAIRAHLVTQKVWKAAELEFEVTRQYEAAHRNDPSYAETSARIAAKAGPAPRAMGITVAEAVYLANKLRGVNDPDGCAILCRLSEFLREEAGR
jgi:hypothetical protein